MLTWFACTWLIVGRCCGDDDRLGGSRRDHGKRQWWPTAVNGVELNAAVDFGRPRNGGRRRRQYGAVPVLQLLSVLILPSAVSRRQCRRRRCRRCCWRGGPADIATTRDDIPRLTHDVQECSPEAIGHSVVHNRVDRGTQVIHNSRHVSHHVIHFGGRLCLQAFVVHDYGRKDALGVVWRPAHEECYYHCNWKNKYIFNQYIAHVVFVIQNKWYIQFLIILLRSRYIIYKDDTSLWRMLHVYIDFLLQCAAVPTTSPNALGGFQVI